MSAKEVHALIRERTGVGQLTTQPGNWHMDTQLLVICVLTFVIHLIGTLAYAARIAGVRTRRDRAFA
jgi:hypothetical protein